MATEDARYRESTQYRLWSFSPSKLADVREKTNSLAKSNIAERLNSATADGAVLESVPDFLTPTEEAQVLTYHTVELLRAGEFCELPTDMRATAAVFLRRFYITNSIMTYPPADMLKTCLFFGSKAEGFFYQNLVKFANKFPNTKPEAILAGEFLLCQGLRFNFDVKHPFRALEGLIMQLREHDDIEPKKIDKAHARAREILKFSPLVTDAYFHYTPSQIAHAALGQADEALLDRMINKTFALPRSAEGDAVMEKANIIGAEIKAKVRDTIRACREMLATEPPERLTEYWGTTDSNQIIKPLIKKLRRCRDPDKTNLVALQRARREVAGEDEDKKPQKGTLKDDSSVFGGDLKAEPSGAREAKRRKVSAEKDDPFE